MSTCSVTSSHLEQVSCSLCCSSGYWVCSYLCDRTLVIRVCSVALSALMEACRTTLAWLREWLWVHPERGTNLLLLAVIRAFELGIVMYLIALTCYSFVTAHRPIAPGYALKGAIIAYLIGEKVEVLLDLPSLKLFLPRRPVLDGLLI